MSFNAGRVDLRSDELYHVTLHRHPLSEDPGPPTQLRTQNAKWKNDNKVLRAGPLRTQLRRKILDANSFWFCVWGPLRGTIVLILRLRTSQRTRELGGPDAKHKEDLWSADLRTLYSYKYRRTCGPASINLYLSARISMQSYCLSEYK